MFSLLVRRRPRAHPFDDEHQKLVATGGFRSLRCRPHHREVQLVAPQQHGYQSLHWDTDPVIWRYETSPVLLDQVRVVKTVLLDLVRVAKAVFLCQVRVAEVVHLDQVRVAEAVLLVQVRVTKAVLLGQVWVAEAARPDRRERGDLGLRRIAGVRHVSGCDGPFQRETGRQ